MTLLIYDNLKKVFLNIWITEVHYKKNIEIRNITNIHNK